MKKLLLNRVENIVAKENIAYPFPIYRPFLTTVQHTTFENIGTKPEIAENEQFLLL